MNETKMMSPTAQSKPESILFAEDVAGKLFNNFTPDIILDSISELRRIMRTGIKEMSEKAISESDQLQMRAKQLSEIASQI